MVDRDRLDIDEFEDDDDYEDTQENKYLTFYLNGEEFGIEIMFVTEIIGIQTITAVPDMPEYVKGVINLRGKVIPVMDVRLRFGAPSRDYDDRTCIVVININNLTLGLVVDTVSEVLDIPPDQIEPAPNIRKKGGNKYVKSMGKSGERVKMLLDAEQLLFDGIEDVQE
jgi:purine-binding chemotaxis protein CheW